MAVLNKLVKFIYSKIKKYLIEIPDLTPEQRAAAKKALAKAWAEGADWGLKAVEKGAYGVGKGLGESLKDGFK